MKKIWDYFKNDKFLLITIIGLLSIGLLTWLVFSKTENFGLNFFTEMLGVAVTVFIIDKLIKNREETKNIPLKLAAYEDVRLYTARYLNFWVTTYRDSVPKDSPERIEDFFSHNEGGVNEIFDFLDMESEPNVYPQRSWGSWLIQNSQEFKERGERILERHIQNLDPSIYGYVHKLTESPFNTHIQVYPTHLQRDSTENIQRVKVLGSYTPPLCNDDFESIIGIVNWCNVTYLKYKKYNKTIKLAPSYCRIKNFNTKPKCMSLYAYLQEQKAGEKKILIKKNISTKSE